MKKALSIILVLCLSLTLCLTMSSCDYEEMFADILGDYIESLDESEDDEEGAVDKADKKDESEAESEKNTEGESNNEADESASESTSDNSSNSNTDININLGNLKTYDASQYKEFLVDYEAFADAFLVAYEQEMSSTEELIWYTGLMHYSEQAMAIMEVYSAQMEAGDYSNMEEMMEFAEGYTRITEKLPLDSSESGQDSIAHNDQYAIWEFYVDETEYTQKTQKFTFDLFGGFETNGELIAPGSSSYIQISLESNSDIPATATISFEVDNAGIPLVFKVGEDDEWSSTLNDIEVGTIDAIGGDASIAELTVNWEWSFVSDDTDVPIGENGTAQPTIVATVTITALPSVN